MSFPSVEKTEEGTSLVEVLLAVAILGIAFAALLGGMSTSAIASGIHRKQATAETVLRSAAEAVKAHPYQDCGNPATYEAAADTAAVTGFVPTVTEVRYWNNNNPA